MKKQLSFDYCGSEVTLSVKCDESRSFDSLIRSFVNALSDASFYADSLDCKYVSKDYDSLRQAIYRSFFNSKQE